MGPRRHTPQEIIDLLGRATVRAQSAEAYHEAAADPRAVEGRAAQQAARDAAAMQLIELAGYADGFIRNRGDPGTTLERFDDALQPVIQLRNEHTHPERFLAPQPITPSSLDNIARDLRKALGNLDAETWRLEPPGQQEALKSIWLGLERVERDGWPTAAVLRPRDLHYAGYYHEIGFGRLAKETGLFEPWGRFHKDPRYVYVSSRISTADDMAHKFNEMRKGGDKSILPVSIVSPEHRNWVPGRSLSGLVRELRDELQPPAERLAELERSAEARAREQYRQAVRGVAQQYAQMTGDKDAAALIYDYVQAQKPPLDHDMIDAMTKALQAAAGPGSGYADIPKAVYNRCLELCIWLDERGDSRLLEILDAADARSRVAAAETVYDIFPQLTRDDDDEPELGMDQDDERGPARGG
jgi:hypothetical protein